MLSLTYAQENNKFIDAISHYNAILHNAMAQQLSWFIRQQYLYDARIFHIGRYT